MKNETHRVRIEVIIDVDAPDGPEARRRGKHSIEQGLDIVGVKGAAVTATLALPPGEAPRRTPEELAQAAVGGDEEAGKEMGERLGKALLEPFFAKLLGRLEGDQ